MNHIFPCTPQGGKISLLYPTWPNAVGYIYIYILLLPSPYILDKARHGLL